MNSFPFQKVPRALLLDGRPPVRMVMLYEDGEGGRRAKRFADEVLHGDGADSGGTASFWNFDVLEHADVRTTAARAAACADFVVFAASGNRALSPELDEWLGMWAWMIGKNNPALVALLEEGSGDGAEAIHSELLGIADRKGLEFVEFHFQRSPQPCGTGRG